MEPRERRDREGLRSHLPLTVPRGVCRTVVIVNARLLDLGGGKGSGLDGGGGPVDSCKGSCDGRYYLFSQWLNPIRVPRPIADRRPVVVFYPVSSHPEPTPGPLVRTASRGPPAADNQLGRRPKFTAFQRAFPFVSAEGT